jgi:hypothetical protein
MFGNRETIDESSCSMIDESHYEVIDDIKEEKRKGTHAGHLCDEGTFHERYDKWTGSTYNRTPRSTAYPSPDSNQTMEYPQPTQQMSAPAQQQPRMQTTVINGRTYERPAGPDTKNPVSGKALAIFLVLLLFGIMLLCSGSPITLIIAIFMGVMIMKASAKGPGTETDKKVNALTALAVVLIIFSAIFSCTGLALLKNFGEFFNEIKET